MMGIRVFTAGGFAENAYLVTCGSGGAAVVVDPGAGASEMLEVVRRENLRIEAIFLTHSHMDHIEGVADVVDWVDAPIYLHPAGRAMYDVMPERARAFGMDLRPPPRPDVDFEAGQSLTFGECMFEVRFTPGHAPGHVILWQEKEGVAFVGDVVFRGSIGRTDLPGGSLKELMRSIREEVLTLPDDTRLLPGHGPETTVADERTGNPFLIPHYGGELA